MSHDESLAPQARNEKPRANKKGGNQLEQDRRQRRFSRLRPLRTRRLTNLPAAARTPLEGSLFVAGEFFQKPFALARTGSRLIGRGLLRLACRTDRANPAAAGATPAGFSR